MIKNELFTTARGKEFLGTFVEVKTPFVILRAGYFTPQPDGLFHHMLTRRWGQVRIHRLALAYISREYYDQHAER